MLEVAALAFDYQDKPLLANIAFALAPGQLLHIHGNNGAGKTTLLKLLVGLMRPQTGAILYQGQSIFTKLRDYQQQLCYIGHKPGINPLLTLKENCLFDGHWGRAAVDFPALLQEFALTGLEDELVAHLSAGQQRRVGLLRLTLTDAKLWVLDEPLAALDQAAIATWTAYFAKHLQRGGQIILSSHQALNLKHLDYQEYTL